MARISGPRSDTSNASALAGVDTGRAWGGIVTAVFTANRGPPGTSRHLVSPSISRTTAGRCYLTTSHSASAADLQRSGATQTWSFAESLDVKHCLPVFYLLWRRRGIGWASNLYCQSPESRTVTIGTNEVDESPHALHTR